MSDAPGFSGEAAVMETIRAITGPLSALAGPSIALYWGGKDSGRALKYYLSFAAVTSLLWGLVGYSEVWGQSINTKVIGGSTYATINKVNETLTWSDILLDQQFALAALAIAFAGVGHRIKHTWAVCLAAAFLFVCYTPLAHWFWNPDGWGKTYNMLEWMGGLHVHLAGGVAALTWGLLSGYKPAPEAADDTTSILAVIGAIVGSFFLALPDVNFPGFSSLASLNVWMSVGASVITWGIAEIALPRGGAILGGSPSVAGATQAAMVGLAAAANGAAFIRPMWMVLTGFVAALFVYIAQLFTGGLQVTGYKVFLTHGFGAAVGTAMTGLFANSELNGAIDNPSGSFFFNSIQLGKQCAGISTVLLLATVASALLFGFFWIIGRVMMQTYITNEEEPALPPVPEAGAKAEPVVSA